MGKRRGNFKITKRNKEKYVPKKNMIYHNIKVNVLLDI